MQAEIVEWFGGFGTGAGFARVAFGYFMGIASYWLYCRIKHRRFFINWRYAGIAVGILIMAGMSVQTQVAYNLAAQTALESKECQRQFNTALQNRSKVASQNDEISQQQRVILFNWIHDLIFPPEPYASMAPDNPERQNYGIALTIETSEDLEKSFKEQDRLQKERDANPLPDPTCGK